MFERIGKSALVILFVFVSCSFWLSASAAEPPALAGLSGAEKARVAKLIEGAKKEGKLVGYSHVMRPDMQAHLLPKFRAWSGLSEGDLKINLVSARTDAITTKISSELQAKVYNSDIIQSATVDWFNDLAERGDLMPYDSPEYKNFGPLSVNPEIAAANPPYFIAGVFNMQAMIAYNPKYVKGEILHWKDCLRPEYKGKISVSDASNSASHTEGYLPLRKLLGAGYYRDLGKQNPFVIVSSQDLINKAISGEYPLVVTATASIAHRANVNGAGLKLVFPSEGIPAVGIQMAILKNAPNPNAAKLFVDYYHSEVGQELMISDGYAVGRLGMKSKYAEFPVPIYDIKGVIPMDWRKVTAQDRLNAREEFRKFVIEKK